LIITSCRGVTMRHNGFPRHGRDPNTRAKDPPARSCSRVADLVELVVGLFNSTATAEERRAALVPEGQK
jgi:hypothetical protein